MEYVHDMRPGSKLLPDSVEDRAKVRMVTEIVASGIQPLQVSKMIHSLVKEFSHHSHISRMLARDLRIRQSGKHGPKDGSQKVSKLLRR